ncbi:hypothetical protein ACFU5O_12480 [Streptomyces sp. NPDC057445]|uniref:hypothetical protein n=1 Tax=Streptomyces sp. NPDC057445 TaxID=3346136 RepID=UPI003677A479
MNGARAYLLLPDASRKALTARAANPGRLEIPDKTAEPRTVAVRAPGSTAEEFRPAGTVGRADRDGPDGGAHPDAAGPDGRTSPR